MLMFKEVSWKKWLTLTLSTNEPVTFSAGACVATCCVDTDLGGVTVVRVCLAFINVCNKKEKKKKEEKKWTKFNKIKKDAQRGRSDIKQEKFSTLTQKTCFSVTFWQLAFQIYTKVTPRETLSKFVESWEKSITYHLKYFIKWGMGILKMTSKQTDEIKAHW